MSDYRGRFVWHELMTTDTKSAGAFYSKIIGWKTQPWGKDLSGAEYTLFVSGKRQLAGLMAVPDDAGWRRTGAGPCQNDGWVFGVARIPDTSLMTTATGTRPRRAARADSIVR